MKSIASVFAIFLCFSVGSIVADEKSPDRERMARSKPLKGKIIQVLPRGILVKALPASVEKDGETFYLPDCWKNDEPIFLFCDSKGMIDGQIKQWAKVYSAGRFQYTSVLGARKTVRALTLDYKQHSKSKKRK